MQTQPDNTERRIRKTRRQNQLLAWSTALTVVIFLLASVKTNNPGSVNLSASFVAITNSPLGEIHPIRTYLPHGWDGPCALFWITNKGGSPRWLSRPLAFRTIAIEQRAGDRWEDFAPSAYWAGPEGMTWLPGSGSYFALAWPPGLPTNASWRIRFVWRTQPRLISQWVSQTLGKQLFRDGPEFTNWTSTVVP